MERFASLVLLTFPILLAARAAGAAEPTAFRPVIADMVHHNPGEPRTVTRFTEPAVIKAMGYRAMVFSTFEAAQFGVDWSRFDPEIFPAGSEARQWVDRRGAALEKEYRAAHDAGLQVYCMMDIVVLPRALVAKHKLARPTDLEDPDTQRMLRVLVGQIFDRFPMLDGLVTRVGETYLHEAPYHMGGVADKQNPAKHIALARLLREEVCEKRGKNLIYRTWLSIDTNKAAYLKVVEAVPPHANLAFSVKHCEGDFHRGHRFSAILGTGPQPQVVEVQCQREYEGKGAYPNYIAAGVIDGTFEENAMVVPAGEPRSLREIASKPQYAGLWTWTRGGGWKGPYITNEFWCELNAGVLARWAQSPQRPEAEIFAEFCKTRLGLGEADAAKFRRLCLLSTEAVVRGKTTTHHDHTSWWSRDQYIGVPPLGTKPDINRRILQEKDEAVARWEEIVSLADQIAIPDAATQEYVRVSSRYGLDLYRIYQAGFHLKALEKSKDAKAVKEWLARYDAAWADYRKLKADHACCATLYLDKGFGYKPDHGAFSVDGVGKMVETLRKK